MRLGKTVAQKVEGARRDRPIGQRNRKLVVLSGVAHIDGAQQSAGVSRDLLMGKPGVRPRLQRGKGELDFAEHIRFERQQPGHGKISAQIGEQKTHGAQDARIARHQDALDVELPGEACGVQRARPAERHQRIVARVMAALHRDHPDGLGHVGGAR